MLYMFLNPYFYSFGRFQIFAGERKRIRRAEIKFFCFKRGKIQRSVNIFSAYKIGFWAVCRNTDYISTSRKSFWNVLLQTRRKNQNKIKQRALNLKHQTAFQIQLVRIIQILRSNSQIDIPIRFAKSALRVGRPQHGQFNLRSQKNRLSGFIVKTTVKTAFDSSA